MNVRGNSKAADGVATATWQGHFQIARVDHWIKNVFVLPGIVVALSIDRSGLRHFDPLRLIIGLAAICIITSSNYVINEILDAPNDRKHPTKRLRPVPMGRVNVPLAYVEWLILAALGLILGWQVSIPFVITLVGLWVMGCVYNIPPVRAKDIPFIDVLTESVNNPLRMLAGWYLTGTSVVPPTSLLISYWMVGCYFMAIKRYAEYREIGDPLSSAAYRKSFGYYNERRLLISIMFYAAHCMLFLGAFIVRYRLELVLSFPLIALVMTTYLSLAFKPHSAVQAPEGLYKEPALMATVTACSLVMIFLLFVDVPVLHRVFVPSEIVP